YYTTTTSATTAAPSQCRTSRATPVTSPTSTSAPDPRASTPDRRLLHDAAGDPLDESIEEEVVENRHGQPDQQRGAHQRAPEVDVAADQLRRHAHRHRLLIAGRDERQPVEEILHREREGKDDRRQHPRDAHREHDADERAELAAAVDAGGFLHLHRPR